MRAMFRGRKRLLMLASTLATIGGAAALPAQQLPAPQTPASAVAHPDIWPQAHWPYAPDPALEKRIADLVARMTIEEKVGQVVQADISSVTPAEVKQYHLGSVLNGGSSGPYGDDLAPPQKWLQLADEFYAASTDTSDGGVGIPVIWGTDAVHGASNIVGATLFPHNVGLGAMHDPALMRKIAEATAVEIRTTGQEWTFAPTITVPQDLRWGRAYEGYSSDPTLVSAYVGQFIRGLQGEPNTGPILAGPHVIASTKHFLADGGTFEGHDQGDARISETELRDIHGLPYVAAIDAGVQTVMVSFSSWNGVKMTGNKSLLTGVLKGRMGFGGFLVSDWNAHGQVEGCTNQSCAKAINAGLDMYMAPDSWKPLWHSLLGQVKDGTVPMKRLDDAVSNILRVKMRLGVFEAGKPSSRLLAGEFDQLGSAEHRALARQAVRESLVLLKNEGHVLPLDPGANILVAGDGADDVARQSGGWTLSWQGTGLDPTNFPGATTIWQGLDAAVKAAGGTATLSSDGSFTGARPDAAIVVFGEKPYAEFQGDLKTLQLKPELRGPLATMKKLKAQGIPVVAVMLTGRPLFVNPEINTADAFVAAWLPGSEGEGVADMLLAGKDGKVAHEFRGTLSFAWPRTANADGPTLFPLGYGLKTTSDVTVPLLPEDAGVAETADSGTFFAQGVPAASWSLIVADAAGQQTRITAVPAKAAAGHVAVTATDHLVQEGARRFAFDGAAPATVALATHAPIDVTRESNGDVMLVTTMRVDAAPARPLTLSMRSGAKTGSIPLAPLGEPGAWRTYGVPLKCFAGQGVDMAHVEMPFALTSSGEATISLAKVSLGTVADQIVACPQ